MKKTRHNLLQKFLQVLCYPIKIVRDSISYFCNYLYYSKLGLILAMLGLFIFRIIMLPIILVSGFLVYSIFCINNLLNFLYEK